MVLVLDKPFLEGRWWKFGAALALFQIVCWLLLIFKVNGVINVVGVLLAGSAWWGTWIVAAFLPFALGRLGLRRLYWCGLIGFALGDLAFFAMALYEPILRVSHLLPFLAFVQLDMTLLSLGVVIELGRYVFKRVFRE